MKKRIWIFFVVLVSLCSIFSTSYAKPFYEGKVIKLIVSTKPGGGYDYYGRMAARYMQKYLPGSTIIVKNVPGAGHIIGCNEVYHSKPNGLIFGTYSVALPLAQVAGVKGIKFDLAKMSWLGSPAFSRQALFVATNTPVPIKTVEDIKNIDELKVASGGIGSNNYVAALVFAKMMGFDNFTISTGYQGGEQQLAMMRGEVHATIMTWGTYYAFVKEGNALPVMFIADDQPEGYGDVPLLTDLATDEKYKPAAELLTGILRVDRFFAGPPGIPADRLEVLREAFKKAWQDPELLKMARKSNRPVRYTSGRDIEILMKRILKQPAEIVELLQTAYGMKN